MHRLIAALTMILCACTPPKPAPQQAFRDDAAPIYSSAVFDAARLEGRWTQVGEFAPQGVPDCTKGHVEFTSTAKGLQAEAQLCLSGVPSRFAGPLDVVGPGRLAMTGMANPWWVLWADGDYRTLVIGTPSGQFGFVLNRDGALPGDRALAVRDVLEWNGYRLANLRM